MSTVSYESEQTDVEEGAAFIDSQRQQTPVTRQSEDDAECLNLIMILLLALFLIVAIPYIILNPKDDCQCMISDCHPIGEQYPNQCNVMIFRTIVQVFCNTTDGSLTCKNECLSLARTPPPVYWQEICGRNVKFFEFQAIIYYQSCIGYNWESTGAHINVCCDGGQMCNSLR